jgi:uncharacterized membrane protein
MDPVSRLGSETSSDRELDATALSRGLGWFTIALGLTGLPIPKTLARVMDTAAANRMNHHDSSQRSASSSLTIQKPPAEVYAFYRKLSQLSHFVNYLALVREADANYSHWVANLPGGGTIAWDTKIIEDRPGELIAWRSVEGSLIKTRGRVTFTSTPEPGATEVRVEMQLESLGDKPSKRVETFFTAAQIQGDLARLKQVLESPSPLPVATTAMP